MATLTLNTLKTTRPTEVILSEKILWGHIPSTDAERKNAVLVLIDNNGCTIAQYIEWINRDSECFALMGADAWAEQGIVTASQLGNLLDAEHDRNVRKSEQYADWN